MDKSKIFVILGGSRPNENYLSRLFVACFSESGGFAQCALETMWRAARLGGAAPDASNFVCDYQPATPDNDGSHPDLCIRSAKGPPRTIFVESKVGAHLGEEQLRRYRTAGVRTLVAVTRNWPEVSRERLRELGINTLRWQDLCRNLMNKRIVGVKDRFIRDAFVQYLESQGMAYREDISISDLKQLSLTLSRVSSRHKVHCVPKKGFAIADNCISLLDDVIRVSKEISSNLNDCTTWGPGYFKNPESETGRTEWNALGFEFYKKGQYWKRKMLCSLYFIIDEKGDTDYITWGVHVSGSEVDEHGRERQITDFMHNGKLDREKMARQILKNLEEWQVVL